MFARGMTSQGDNGILEELRIWSMKDESKHRGGKVVLLSGGNPQIAKADGDAHGRALINIHEDDLDEAQMATWVKQAAALPGWVP